MTTRHLEPVLSRGEALTGTILGLIALALLIVGGF